jgi:hypothetical protein
MKAIDAEFPVVAPTLPVAPRGWFKGATVHPSCSRCVETEGMAVEFSTVSGYLQHVAYRPWSTSPRATTR